MKKKLLYYRRCLFYIIRHFFGFISQILWLYVNCLMKYHKLPFNFTLYFVLHDIIVSSIKHTHIKFRIRWSNTVQYSLPHDLRLPCRSEFVLILLERQIRF